MGLPVSGCDLQYCKTELVQQSSESLALYSKTRRLCFRQTLSLFAGIASLCSWHASQTRQPLQTEAI